MSIQLLYSYGYISIKCLGIIRLVDYIFYVTNCNASVEQSATTDQGCLLTTDILAGNQVSSFPSVIWLMEVWRCLC